MYKILVLAALMSISAFGFADIKYFNGKIERIETCKSGGTVYLFVKDVTGTTPSASNGCSNDVSYPYVRLNNNNQEVSELEKVMLSTALAAQAADRSIRVRFDDQTKSLISIAID